MMKKVFKIIFNSLLILLLLAPYILEPYKVYAESKATTLAGLRQELASLQAQKKASQNSISSTESAIKQKNAEVANAYAEIQQSETDIEIAKNQITESNQKISSLKEKTEELLDFYEIIDNDDSYMEYVTGASTMTDLIMRMDAVNTLTEYNKDSIVELEDLIDQNEQLQVDLLAKQDQLQTNIDTYKSKLNSLQDNLSSLLDVSMDIDDQIKSQKDLITYYASLGCKEDQDLDQCVIATNNGSWLKPLVKGVVTSPFGYRYSPITGKYSFHNGIDIGGNKEGTSLYAVGSGTVAFVIYKASCGGNQVYMNVQVAGVKYTVMYAHMLTVNVKAGDKFTANTVIGTLGGGAGTWSWETCSTGAHVHMSVAKGFYTTYSSFIANQMNPPGFPSKGTWFYSRTQWFS